MTVPSSRWSESEPGAVGIGRGEGLGILFAEVPLGQGKGRKALGGPTLLGRHVVLGQVRR
jgi:hypothetical protein